MAIVEGSLSFRPNRCVSIRPPITCVGPSDPTVSFLFPGSGFPPLRSSCGKKPLRWFKRTSVIRSVVDQSGRETGYFQGFLAVRRGLADGLAQVLHLLSQGMHLRLKELGLHPDKVLNVPGVNDFLGKLEGR